jgi:hypothetical protein
MNEVQRHEARLLSRIRKARVRVMAGGPIHIIDAHEMRIALLTLYRLRERAGGEAGVSTSKLVAC